MTNDLIEYYNNITYKNKEVAEYNDNEGNYFVITPSNLIVAVQRSEMDLKQFEQAKFNQIVPKDFECNNIEITKLVSKSEITKDEKDQFTLVEKKEKGKEFWIVQNGLQIRKAFDNKEDALKLAKEINKKIFEVSGIEIYK